MRDNKENKLSSAGITGISDSFKVFKNSADIGTILVYFTETGFTHFASHPVNELFNISLSLDDIFKKDIVAEVEEKLALATTDKHRIKIIEQFPEIPQAILTGTERDLVVQRIDGAGDHRSLRSKRPKKHS